MTNDEEDASLVLAVRSGRPSAYGQLYERHAGAARGHARRFSLSAFEVDDLVSEAFTRVLATLQAGRGPTMNFRAYLFTTLRHVAYTTSRHDRRVRLVDDMAEVLDHQESAASAEAVVVSTVEAAQVAKVFVTLPERWRMALWRTEVEGRRPADIARILGISSNGAAALVCRAREGLRRSYLRHHPAEAAGQCRSRAAASGQVVRTVA